MIIAFKFVIICCKFIINANNFIEILIRCHGVSNMGNHNKICIEGEDYE